MLSVPEMTDADPSRIIAEEACILIEVLLITSLMFSKHDCDMFTTSVSVQRFPDATPALSGAGGKVKERTALQAKRAPLLCPRLRASQAGSSITHMGLLPKYLFGKDFLLLTDCLICAAS